MNAPVGRTGLKYKSHRIRERRSRILRETRHLLAEVGYEGFNVRDLCLRAEISQKTLYNIFGVKDNVISAAIREFLNEFNDFVDYGHFPDTLEGYLEGMVAIQTKNMAHRSYVAATISLYLSHTNNKTIRSTLKAMWMEALAPFVAAIEAKNGFAAGISASAFIQVLSLATFAVTAEWCLGGIPDEDFIDRVADTSLMIIAGSCKGRVSAQARRWLEDVRQKRPSWIELRKQAEANTPMTLSLAS